MSRHILINTQIDVIVQDYSSNDFDNINKQLLCRHVNLFILKKTPNFLAVVMISLVTLKIHEEISYIAEIKCRPNLYQDQHEFDDLEVRQNGMGRWL